MKFDDFKQIDGDLAVEFENMSVRFVKIFLRACGINKVDKLAVKLKLKPFVDILIGFEKNGQAFLLDKSAIKQKSLHERYDSILAEIFLEMDSSEQQKLCTNLETKLKTLFVKNKNA